MSQLQSGTKSILEKTYPDDLLNLRKNIIQAYRAAKKTYKEQIKRY